jgi:hypothetical protein
LVGASALEGPPASACADERYVNAAGRHGKGTVAHKITGTRDTNKGVRLHEIYSRLKRPFSQGASALYGVLASAILALIARFCKFGALFFQGQRLPAARLARDTAAS